MKHIGSSKENIMLEETHVAGKGSWGDNGGFRAKALHSDVLSAVDLISDNGQVGASKHCWQNHVVCEAALTLHPSTEVSWQS